MQIPGMLKPNPFRDFADDPAAGHAPGEEIECSHCHQRVSAANRGAAPWMLVMPASLFSDVARNTGNLCSGCARNVNLLGTFGLLLLIGELAIVVAEVKKYF
jgi:hypothetical protein